MKLFILTAVDYNPEGHDPNGECNGKAKTIGVFRTFEEANNAFHSNLSAWINKNQDEGIEYDTERMCAWFDYNPEDCCEWNIEEVEIPIPDESRILSAQTVLSDNGIDPDEVDTVLQAVGFALLDANLYPGL